MAKATKALVPIVLCLMLLAVGCAKKPPIMTGLSRNSGPSGGGTKITITGENFKEGATVTIGGKALVGMTINVEGTSVTGTTPGGAPGSQQVIARNLKAKDPSLAATFTYDALKVISTDPADGTQLDWYPGRTQASAKLSQPTQSGSASISIGDVTGQVSYDAATQTVTFTANESLPTGASYTVAVSGAKDMAGNTLSSYSFGFSIAEAVKLDWYTVQEGDTLKAIAAKPEVYEDAEKWMLIYEGNQSEFVSEDGEHGNDAILDFQNLVAGMELYIPR